ncbi:MAG: 1-acyl-sn-glycerol-3-phosphate acyltransferase [Proteobacteria bacterium]|nr:1-acyl-sn-glycerol-3-phosphate acyltransferase [Pseudomonadota bacterium]
MDWQGAAEALWRVRWWFVPVFAALYLVPLFRVAGMAFEGGGSALMRVNRLFGLWEHAVFIPRDTLATAYLAGGFLWHLFLALELASPEHAAVAAAALALMSAGWAQRHFRRQGHMALAEFASRNPTVHPQEFFDHLFCVSGAIRHRLPQSPARVIDPAHLDFRNHGKGARLRWPTLACGAWSTAWLAKLLVSCGDMKNQRWLARFADAMALVWASRLAQLMRAEVSVEGADRLAAHAGPQMLLYTHASFVDFALAPLVPASMAAQPGGPRKGCVPSFLIAKDHFRDNPLYYRLLGIGRAAEALGMIFVERRGRSSPARARGVVWQATGKMVDEGAMLGIYPQGTRATPCTGVEGERLDSAYYTVGEPERIKRDGAHLKRGAAFIAVEAAMGLAAAGEREGVRIVPVAIKGSGIACPRGSARIMSDVRMRLVIGEPIRILASDVAGLKSPDEGGPHNKGEERYFEFADHLHRRIDVSLKEAYGVHAVLERRFFEDVRGLLDHNEIEEVALAVKPWRGDDFLFHAVLDAIYCAPPSKWRRFLGELVHLMLNFATREEMLAFKGRVVDGMSM